MGTWCQNLLNNQDHPRNPSVESKGRLAHFFDYSFHYSELQSSRLYFFTPSKIIEKKRTSLPAQAQFAQDHVLEAAGFGSTAAKRRVGQLFRGRGPQSEQEREAPGSSRGRHAAAITACKVED